MGSPSFKLLKTRKILMHKLDRNRTLANRRSAPLHGVITNIAGDKDPGHAGLQKIRLSIERPLHAAPGLQVRTGQPKTLAVAGQPCRPPVGLGFCANKDEQRRSRPRLVPTWSL